MTSSNTGEDTREFIPLDTPKNFDNTVLRGIENFDDAWRLVQERYGQVADASKEIGSGFTETDKHTLVDQAFLIIHYSFQTSTKYINPETHEALSFVVVHFFTREDGRKGWFTDGSTGVYAQLDEYGMRTQQYGGVYVKGGLRLSTYDKEDDDGNVVVQGAETFYLNV